MNPRARAIHSSDGFLLNVGAAALRAFHEQRLSLEYLNKDRDKDSSIVFADTRLELCAMSRFYKDSLPDTQDAGVAHLKTEYDDSKDGGADIVSTKHVGVICDRCGEHDFSGLRYKCACCADFDLCAKCHALEIGRMATNYEDAIFNKTYR